VVLDVPDDQLDVFLQRHRAEIVCRAPDSIMVIYLTSMGRLIAAGEYFIRKYEDRPTE
jgi:hypothetical protein